MPEDSKSGTGVTLTQGERSASLVVHTGAGIVVFQVLTFLATILIARELGPAGQGRYHLWIATAMMAALVAKFGFDEAISYLIPQFQVRNPDRQFHLIRYVLLLTFSVSVCLGLLFYLFADVLDTYLFPFEDYASELKLLIFLIPVLVVMLMGLSVLRGQGRSDVRSYIYYYGVGGLFLLSLWCFSDSGLEAGEAYWVRISTVFIGATAALFFIYRFVGEGRQPLSAENRKKVWTFGGFMVLVAASQYLLTQPFIDLLIVGHVATPEEVGIYSVAIKLGSLVIIAYNALLIVMGPVLAEALAAGEREQMAHQYRRSSEWMGVLSAYMGGGILVLANEALSLFGPEYESGLYLLLVIVVTRILIGCMGPNLALLLGAERLKLEFILTASALLLFLVLSVILGVLYGAIGVAISTGSVMVLHEFCRHVACRRLFNVRLPGGLWRLVLVSCVSIFLTLWLKSNLDNTAFWVEIGVVGAVFSVFFWGIAQVMGIGPSLPQLIRGRSERGA